MGISLETGFNWGSVTKKDKSEAKTFRVGPIMVPAGEVVWVEGAVGTCGGITVETHMYRIKSSKTGDVLTIGN